jgi:hypothetical protein
VAHGAQGGCEKDEHQQPERIRQLEPPYSG